MAYVEEPFRKASMMSDSNQYFVPEVPAAQLALDQTRKHLCKLRWIGKGLEARTTMGASDNARRKRNHCDAFQENLAGLC
jgi:hypothetical protein